MSDSNTGNSPDLSTYITTTSLLDDDPAAFRVSWVDWNSDFRNGGLLVGDQIVALNGKPVVRPDAVADRQCLTQTFAGQYAEAQRWSAAGAHAGSAVTLQGQGQGLCRSSSSVDDRFIPGTPTIRVAARFSQTGEI